jgi:predicted HTH transcriptional regulator
MEAVTQATLLEAIRQALAPQGAEDALTTREIAKKFGRSHDWARERVRELLERGDVERVGVVRVGIDGVPQTVSGYRTRV